ncbi:MAG TPA: hypothetical protein VNG69_14835 [Casimicrobiaceae bacterium]|nr:hypothetical protein [Casimicrobiaceae bacterium]
MAPAPSFPNAVRPLLVLASLALVLWLLSWLQPVLIPIALAILLTFMLAPDDPTVEPGKEIASVALR